MEDRIGQVWASKWYEDPDLSNATVFVIVRERESWINPHTGKISELWEGRVLSCTDDRSSDVGRMYVWNEDCFLTGGDGYDNVYERIV